MSCLPSQSNTLYLADIVKLKPILLFFHILFYHYCLLDVTYYLSPFTCSITVAIFYIIGIRLGKLVLSRFD